MRLRLTIILLLLNAGVFYSIYLLERSDDPRQDFAERAPTLVPDALAIVELSMSIRYEGQIQERVLRKSEDGWMIKEPFRWPANEAAMQNILSELQFLDVQTRIPLRDLRAAERTLADYGLETPQIEIRARGPLEEIQLDLGEPTVMGKRIYLHQPGSDEIVVVGARLLDALAVPMDLLRQQAAFSLNPFEVRAITAEGPQGELVRLERRGEGWALEAPVRTSADDDRVKALIAELLTLRAVAIHPGMSPADAGLAEPAARVILSGSRQRQSLLLGAAAPELESEDGKKVAMRYARFEGEDEGGTIFTLAAAPFDILFDAGSTLRSRAVWDFDPAAVTAVEIKNAGRSLTLQRLEGSPGTPGSSWQMLFPARGQIMNAKAQPEIVEQFLEAMAELQTSRFIQDDIATEDLAQWGLDDPVATVSIKAPHAHRLLLGDNVSGQPHELYAKRVDQATIISLPLRVISLLSANPLDYRLRKILPLPESVSIQSIRIRGVDSGDVYLQARKDGDDWLVIEGPDGASAVALRSLVKELRGLQARSFLYEGRENVPGWPWQYRLEAAITIPGGAENKQEVVSFLLNEPRGNRQIAVMLPDGPTFLLSQAMIDALFPYIEESLKPELPANPRDVKAGSPAIPGDDEP